MSRQGPVIETRTIWDRIFEKDKTKWKRPDEKIVQLADTLSRRGLKTVYDLGCGTGRHTAYFASGNFEVYGSDISTRALERTRNRLAQDSLTATLVQTDMAGQPFKDAAFDAVISYGVLFHNILPKIRESIQEVNRILKPGGSFFSTLQSTEDWKYGRGQEIEDDGFILEEKDHAESGQVHHFFTKDSLTSLFRGFDIIELEHRKHKDVFYHPDENLQYAVWLVLAQKRQTDVRERASFISQLLQAAFARDFFERNLRRFGWAEYSIQDCAVTPLDLSKRGGKAVLEFKLRLQNLDNANMTSKVLIAKWRPDTRNSEIFFLMQELWKRGFQGPDHLRICEPIAYLPEHNLMLTSKAPGLELDIMLATDHPQLKTSIIQAAHWLAKLHTTRVVWTRDYTVENEKEKLKMWQQHLTTLFPSTAKTLELLANRLIQIEETVSRESYVLVHGDFHPKNIFIDRGDLTAIDLEQSKIFDPARDLGYFTAQLEMKSRKYGLSRQTKTLRQLFLTEYSPTVQTNLLTRVKAHEAMTYLQHLHFIYWTLKKKTDPADFRHWIGKAEECLQKKK